MPVSHLLIDAYPNPFNPEVTINYNLKKAGDVELYVINLLGQRVTTLVNEYQDAGNYNLSWNTATESDTELASGIYFAILRQGNEGVNKKLILLK